MVAGPYVLAGPTVGRRVACYRTASDGKGTNLSVDCATEDDDDPFKTYDFGVSVGAGMSFDIGGLDMVVEALYSFGILDILAEYDKIDEYDDAFIKNRGFVFRVGVDVGR